ncbi:MAG: lyase family protein, partial [Candidatus Thorarchaeota archaeon]
MSEENDEYREETDLIGARRIPIDALYGVQSLRAKENFGVSMDSLYKYTTLIQSLAMVKKACALANRKLDHLSEEYAKAIIQACDEIIGGEFHDAFIVDMLQGGAGTSTNMNLNEVIAARANEILGHPRNSQSPIDANDHVNMSQSTNDVYPTGIKIATIFSLRDLALSLRVLIVALDEKADKFMDTLKLGRTEMQ